MTPKTETAKPQWAETVMFWGAGATAHLGLPITEQTGKYIHELTTTKTAKTLRDRISKQKCFFGAEKKIEEFLTKDKSPDWNSLRLLANKIPFQNGSQYLMDLYNLIDNAIHSGRGIAVENENVELPKSEEQKILELPQINNAKITLNFLSQAFFACAWRKMLKENPERIKPYISFVETLSELMRKESLNLQNKDFKEREFYLASYAIVSMNYDPTLLWLLFNAHKKHNDNPPHLGKQNGPVKLFTDQIALTAFKGWDKSEITSYSYNEAIAKIINKHNDYLIRLVKFYLPHGCVNFRECKLCGKVTMLMGNDWEYKSETLYPKMPFEDEGKNADVSCLYCENKIDSSDAIIIPQTSFKGFHNNYLEEIQRETKLALANAKHIILMGYQLPPDDVVWRSALFANRKGDVFCSVAVGNKGEKRWLKGGELESYVESVKKRENPEHWSSFGINAIEAAWAVFGEGKVRAWTGGIPEVWESGADAVYDLLYPREIFKNGVER